MEPMKPMQPMKPMRPMSGGETWWPRELGEPSASGSQSGLRYAFFPAKRRLLVEQGGKLTAYDSGNHQISGVAQQSGQGGTVAFADQNGSVTLNDLKRC